MNYPNSERPFAFEDLPIKDGKRVEPEAWGPIYTKPPAKPKALRAYDPPTNAPSGQKGPVVDCAKHRAKIKAEFVAAANAERRAWADGKPRPGPFGKDETIVTAYELAMAAKRARLADLAAVAAVMSPAPAPAPAPRKPHYVLREGKWKLAA